MTRQWLSIRFNSRLLRDMRHKAPEVLDAVLVDAMYRAYDDHPLDEPDEWGDLASFREAAARS